MVSVKANVIWGVALSVLMINASQCTEEHRQKNDSPEKKALLTAVATVDALQNRGGVKELTPAEDAFLQEAKKFLAEVKVVTTENLIEFRDKVIAILKDEPAYKNACVAAQAVSDLKPSFALAKKLDAVLKMMPDYMQNRLQRAFKDLGLKRMIQLSKPFLASLWGKREKLDSAASSETKTK